MKAQPRRVKTTAIAPKKKGKKAKTMRDKLFEPCYSNIKVSNITLGPVKAVSCMKPGEVGILDSGSLSNLLVMRMGNKLVALSDEIFTAPTRSVKKNVQVFGPGTVITITLKKV